MVQQCRANPLPLVLVDGGESHLGLLRFDDDVTSAADNHWPSAFLYHCDQGHVSDKVKVQEESKRVLGEHSFKLADPVVAAEAGEERDGGIDHALGLGDHDRAAAKAGEPMALPSMVALDPMRLVLADVE